MANRPTVHGPVRIINTGENVWGGRLSFTVETGSGSTVITISGLSTKSVRTTGNVFLMARNGTAGNIMASQRLSGTTMVGVNEAFFATVSTNGQIRIRYPRQFGSGTASFFFTVFDGGTSV